MLESAIVDADGRLFFTSQVQDGQCKGAVWCMDRPDSEPAVVRAGISAPGGMAFNDDGRLIVGVGDDVARGLLGNVIRRAGLLLIDPETGAGEKAAVTLGMANGIARAADGAIFASNDLGTHIERIEPDYHTVQRRWANVWSANGLAIDPSGRYLYATQTFAPSAIKRIEIARPPT